MILFNIKEEFGENIVMFFVQILLFSINMQVIFNTSTGIM